MADAIAKLRRARDAGIQTIVDPTVLGLGRYIPRIQRSTPSVDINIVVATGVYAFLELPGFLALPVDDVITEIFVREIREGIDDTGVKAAFIKCAVEEHGIVGDMPRILRCVAAASVETGAPVMVHTNAPAQTGLLALDVPHRRGRRPAEARDRPRRRQQRPRLPARTSPTAAPRSAAIATGSSTSTPSADRIATTTALIEQGYAAASTSPTTPPASTTSCSTTRRSRTRRPDYLRIHNALLPALLANGVEEEQIDQMLVENPRRFFS